MLRERMETMPSEWSSLRSEDSARQDRVAQARAAQLGVIVSSCLGSQCALSDRLAILEGTADLHDSLSRAIQQEVGAISNQGHEVLRYLAARDLSNKE